MQSPTPIQQSILKHMKQVRRDILSLIQTYIEQEQDFTKFNQTFLPALQNLIEDFRAGAPEARDPEVLNLFATILKMNGQTLQSSLNELHSALCEPTLQMIQNDTVSFPEFRQSLFVLIQNMIEYCTAGLFANLQPDKFQNIILIVLFSIQHEKPDLMEIGLDTMHKLLKLLEQEPNYAQIFYKTFFTKILQDTLVVMTDYRHVAGFKTQGMIIQMLVQAVSNFNLIGSPQAPKLLNKDNQEHQFSDNKEYAVTLLTNSVLEMFQNLNKVQVEAFVIKLFNSCDDWKSFKGTLRDLLISSKSFASTNDQFYEEEKQTALKQQKELEELRKKSIPGLLQPGQM